MALGNMRRIARFLHFGNHTGGIVVLGRGR
jgi:hypothetical protein